VKKVTPEIRNKKARGKYVCSVKISYEKVLYKSTFCTEVVYYLIPKQRVLIYFGQKIFQQNGWSRSVITKW
jgi:hypothetical protein